MLIIFKFYRGKPLHFQHIQRKLLDDSYRDCVITIICVKFVMRVLGRDACNTVRSSLFFSDIPVVMHARLSCVERVITTRARLFLFYCYIMRC